MLKPVEAEVEVALPSERFVEIIVRALKPETESAPSDRSQVAVSGEGSRLLLWMRARDFSSFRAALNSYLRWVEAMGEVLSLLEAGNR